MQFSATLYHVSRYTPALQEDGCYDGPHLSFALQTTKVCDKYHDNFKWSHMYNRWELQSFSKGLIHNLS